MTILVDTREHKGKNDHILNYFDAKGISWERRKIDYGDYSFYLPKNEELGIDKDYDFSNQIMVERKANLEELSGNHTKERIRLENEFRGAPPNKILLIENATYHDMVNGNYNTEYSPKAFWASMFTMWHRYNIPTIFLEDKKYTGQYIYGYFRYYLYEVLKEADSQQSFSLTNGVNYDIVSSVSKGVGDGL